MKIYQVIVDNQETYEDYHEYEVATFTRKAQAEDYVRLAKVGEHETLECDHYSIKEFTVEENVSIAEIAHRHFASNGMSLLQAYGAAEYTAEDDKIEAYEELSGMVKEIQKELSRLTDVFREYMEKEQNED